MSGIRLEWATADRRFEASHHQSVDDWTLRESTIVKSCNAPLRLPPRNRAQNFLRSARFPHAQGLFEIRVPELFVYFHIPKGDAVIAMSAAMTRSAPIAAVLVSLTVVPEPSSITS